MCADPPAARGARGARLLALTGLLAVAPSLGGAWAQDDEPPILGAPAAIGAAPSERSDIHLTAGVRLYPEPDAELLPLAVVDADIELPVLEQRGAWAQVRYGGLRGWVDPTLTGPPARSALPPAVAEALADPPSPGARPASRGGPDPVRLARARQLIGENREATRLGPWPLYTDIADEALVSRLGAVASHLDEAYRERYALEPTPPQQQAVVLFSDENVYRAYEAEETEIASLGASGHTTHGIAALFAGKRNGAEMQVLLTHELTHLMNRRSLGPHPPPWLEEGMANDLAYCRTDEAGRPRLGTLAGEASLTSHSVPGRGNLGLTVHVEGPAASFGLLVQDLQARRAPPLAALLDMPWRPFVDGAARELHYSQSAFFVRYLLDGERGRFAAGFRDYLAGQARGGASDGAALLAHLGTGFDELERRFYAWVRAAQP